MKYLQLRKWGVSLITVFTLFFLAGTALADTFLEPDQAFKLKSELRDAGTLVLTWDIAPGYHLYRERLNFKTDQAEAGLGEPKLPAAIRKFDSNLGKEMETYQDHLVVELPLTKANHGGQAFTFTVGYQGCADAGLCYPPMEQAFRVDPAKPGMLAVTTAAAGAAPAPSATPAAPAASAAATKATNATASVTEDDNSLAQRTLQSGSVWRIGIAFLVFGLLLSFTPCVLPMVPILSSIIVGEGSVSRGRGFSLALAYCLGMALVYTSLGVAAGLAGEGLAGALQKPWVLLTFGCLLVGLALSMFDVYQLQLPSGLQNRLNQTSSNLRGGRFIGVFVMGALSALIVGPCVAGPLAGALLYISQTHNVWIGGWALFSMAAGMSVPLLLTGISAGSLLPRAGAWMNQVKRVFGLLLIAVAIWMVSPVFSITMAMAMWGSFAVLCAVFLHVFEPLPAGAKLRVYFTKTLGLVFLIGGLFELVGAASSGNDVLQPLAHLRGANSLVSNSSPASHGEVKFTRVRNIAELEQTLATAKTPAILDFYADWCVSCKEMERFTFSDAKVGEQLKQVRLLQVDVTANSDEDKALMKKYSLFGPPGIILFSADGKEIPQSRIIGFLAPDPFLQHLLRFFAV